MRFVHEEEMPKAPPSPPGIDAAVLLALELPPLREIVPGLIVEGTTILAAAPKVGKSCICYQICVEVALGGELFGRRVTSGSALYFALEDGARRGQSRLKAALAGRTMPGGRLEVRWNSRRIGEGLEEDISTWLAEHEDAAVVVVDTLARARPRSNGRRGAYEVDVEDLGRLQNLFRDRPVALIVVHHSHKPKSDDFLAAVSGTYGITGSTDSTVFLSRKRLEDYGTIEATGRDIPEMSLPVQFDGMLWREASGVLVGAAAERRRVFEVIQELGPIFPAAIAKMLGKERSNVAHLVEQLYTDGAVSRAPGGYIASSLNTSTHSIHSKSDDSE